MSKQAWPRAAAFTHSPQCLPHGGPPALGRSWELATQLARDVLPALRARGVKLYFVSIGYPERGRKFSEQTGERQRRRRRGGGGGGGCWLHVCGACVQPGAEASA